MKTHGKTLIILLIICMIVQMMPALVFAVSDPNAAAAEAGQATTESKDAPAAQAQAMTEDKDAPAGEVQADDNTDGKTEGGKKESKDSEEQTPGTSSADTQALKETEPKADPNASEDTLNTGDSIDYKGWREGSGGGQTALFTATSGDKSYTGTCAQAGVALTATGTAEVTRIANDSKIAKAIYHFAYELGEVDNWWTSSHRLDNVGSIIGVSGTQFTKRKMLECFCQIHNMGAQKWYDVCTNAGVAKATAKAVRKYYENLNVSGVTVPDSFEIYLAIPTNASQRFIMWRMAAEGPVESKVLTVSKKNSATGAELAGAQLQILQGSAVVVPTWTTTATPKVINDLGSGTYTLREIKAPYGFEVADDVTFTLDGKSDKTVTMSDAPVTVKTTAVDPDTEAHMGSRKTASKITDTVHMTGLVKDRKYRLTGTLMNKRTGQAVPNVTVSPKEFTATAAAMDVTMDFTFDSTALAGGDSVVVFETLCRTSQVHSGETVPAGGVELVKHEDINDAAQTVSYPSIKTRAAISDDRRTITDTISYTNLLPGKKYRFRGWLVDTASGTKVNGSDGTVDLTAGEDTSGSVAMKMDASGYDSIKGHSITAFEELYIIETVDGKEKEAKIAEHKDRSGDASSNPQIIEIYQALKIKKNVTGNLGDLTKVFEYTAEFTGLVPGRPYKIEGDDEKTFMADASGKASAGIRLKDGQTAVIRELPKGAEYKVTEAASDHVAEYRIFPEDMEKKGAKIVKAEDSNGADAGKALSTAQETVDQFDGTVVILWENNRDLAAITGVNTDTGIWAAAFGTVLACLAAMVISIRKNQKNPCNQNGFKYN